MATSVVQSVVLKWKTIEAHQKMFDFDFYVEEIICVYDY
jgi:hypothetical protein